MFEGNRVVAHTGTSYPVFQAPMTMIARAPLVAAVSAAGGVGLLETSSVSLPVTMREFAAIREATDRPFGVNLPVQMLKRDPDEEKRIIEWLLEQDVRFVTTSAGDPGRYIDTLKSAGVTVYHATSTLHGALKAVDAGVDGLVVEGAESAGIRNAEEVHSFALLQAVRENVDLPIVAAGGIVDGRGMAAAFALGAEGVAMGTRFVASQESPVHANYKEAIVDAPAGGTLMTELPPRGKFRGLKSEYAIEMHAGRRERNRMDSVLQELYIDGDVVNTSGPAGESSGLIHEVKTVKQIIDDTVSGFWKEIDRLAALRGIGG